jgi:hypothetical protein
MTFEVKPIFVDPTTAGTHLIGGRGVGQLDMSFHVGRVVGHP